MNLSKRPPHYARLRKTFLRTIFPYPIVRDISDRGVSRRKLGKSSALVCAAVLAILTFFVNASIALKLDQLKVFDQSDVIFDLDTKWRLHCFMWGDGGMGRTLVHPNLCNLVHPAVVISSKATRQVAPSLPHQGSLRDSRHFFGLMVGPVASGLAVLALFMLGTAMGLELAGSTLLAVLYAGSFSALTFGSVPDHYALGGLSICLILYVAALTLRERSIGIVPWVAVVAFAGSITITHGGMAILVCGICQLIRRGLAAGLVRAAIAGTVGLVIILGIYLGSGVDTTKPATTFNTLGRWITLFYDEVSPYRKLIGFPNAMAGAIAADALTLVDQPPVQRFTGEQVPQQAGTYTKMVVMIERAVPRTVLTLVICLLTGTWLAQWLIGVRRRELHRPDVGFFTCCVAVLAINGILHAFWGFGYFLYSQHWLAASVCPIALSVVGRDRSDSRIWVVALGCLTAAVCVNNYVQLTQMIMLLEQAQ